MDGHDPLRQGADTGRIPGGNGPHADLVLVVGFGGAGKGGGGHGRLEGLRRQGGGSDGHGLESMVMDPRLSGHADEIGREPPVHVGIDEERHLPVRHVGHRREGRFQGIHGKGDVAPVEISPHQGMVRLRGKEGVVVGAVRLDLDPRPDPRQGVVQNTHDLGGAPQGIGILKGLRTFRFEIRPGCPGRQELPDSRGDVNLPREGFGLPDGGMVVVGLALKGMDAQGGSADRRIQDMVRPVEDDGGNPGHDGGPVDHGQRLLQLEGIGFQLRLSQRLPAGMRSPR